MCGLFQHSVFCSVVIYSLLISQRFYFISLYFCSLSWASSRVKSTGWYFSVKAWEYGAAWVLPCWERIWGSLMPYPRVLESFRILSSDTWGTSVDWTMVRPHAWSGSLTSCLLSQIYLIFIFFRGNVILLPNIILKTINKNQSPYKIYICSHC